MKGLVNDSMQRPMEEEARPPPGEMPADEGADENDPGFAQALQFAMSALYESGAAKQIAQTLRGSQNIAEALANTTYEIVSVADERTQGAVPDELLVLFASRVLEEVVDVAAASGIQVKSADIATAMKQMILRYVGENGGNTADLQAAMDKVDPAAFNEEAPAPAQKGAPPA